MKKTVMRKYAQLAVRRGAHVKKGQGCVIYAQVEQHEFAQMVAEEPTAPAPSGWRCAGRTRFAPS